VLDDDVRFIRMVERILKSEDISIEPVTTPDLDEAVRVVSMAGCRAALVDIYLYGEAAGFDLIERLRAHPLTSELPLIVTSGAYREIARNLSFLEHFNCAVLPKPFEVEALLHQLDGVATAAVALQLSDPTGGDWNHRRAGNWRLLLHPLRRLERTA
jgi:CheY-like chemotaxis protein